MPLQFNVGDIAYGPSVSSNVDRYWLIMYAEPSTFTIIGQNMRARKPYRHILKADSIARIDAGYHPDIAEHPSRRTVDEALSDISALLHSDKQREMFKRGFFEAAYHIPATIDYNPSDSCDPLAAAYWLGRDFH